MASRLTRRRLLLGSLSTALAVASRQAPGHTLTDEVGGARVWVSTEDLRLRLTELPRPQWQTSASPGTVVDVNGAETFQVMLGFGASLEPATCWNLWQMTKAEREQVLAQLLGPPPGIGMNLMRICIGTPDFTGDPWYSYNDLPPGETDPELSRFSIERDRAYILPILELARAANPDLLFFASPWSPPGWMKTTGTMIGGSLLPRWYAAYAEYFVRFIRAYEAEGVPIHAVTVQNEPGVDRSFERNPAWHYPSCRWTGEQERDFIRDHLGPALRRHGLTTRIWCYDHNYNSRPRPGDAGLAHPRTVLSDPGAAAFVAGVAFHGYVGQPSGMDEFHREFPSVPLHFTEGSVFGLEGGIELIERLRNHASSYNAWVTVLDDRGKPNNGPFEASRTIITVNPETFRPAVHFDYYLYGHFMRFIPRGAVRIGSTAAAGMPNVAFRRRDGSVVLVLVNADRRPQDVVLRTGGRVLPFTVPASAIATAAWVPGVRAGDADYS